MSQGQEPTDDLVSDATKAEEEREAGEQGRADRPPTAEEEQAAERSGEVDPKVSEAHRAANERGAHVEGEGKI